jgi:hemerythrin-like domain-containing protein
VGRPPGYARLVKRHPALVPLSHDHHDALVAARRLRRGADGDDRVAAARAFLTFFDAETIQHFREEEETLFPQVIDRDEAGDLVVAALRDHQRLHAMTAQLANHVASGTADPDLMRALAEQLEIHIRREERELFPVIQDLLTESELTGLAIRAARGSNATDVPGWSAASEELNATLLVWKAGAGPPEHVNAERDVLVVVLAGSLTLSVDGDARKLAVGEAAIIDKGRRRAIAAGPDGTRYLSVHRRRPNLQIRSRPDDR